MKRGFLLTLTLFVCGAAWAQDYHVSAGVLGGVSFGTQTDAVREHAYFPIPNPTLTTGYTDTWAKLNGTLFLDLIYGYLDLALSGVVGQVSTTENQAPQKTFNYTHDPEDYGLSHLSLNVGLGVKMPITLFRDITVYPLIGLDILSRTNTDSSFFTSTFMPLLRVGAGGDFTLDSQLYLRVLIDYSCSQNFSFVDIKTGIGVKL